MQWGSSREVGRDLTLGPALRITWPHQSPGFLLATRGVCLGGSNVDSLCLRGMVWGSGTMFPHIGMSRCHLALE